MVDHDLVCPSASTPGTAHIADYQPDQVEVQADSPSGGLLILTDSYDSAWTVTIDSVPAALLRVDTALRGVCLPAGAHTVRFSYQPGIFWLGVGVSLSAWLALLIAAIGLIFRASRKNPFRST